MTDEERAALAEKIAAALRASMSEPGQGYIDFTYHVGVNIHGEPYGPFPREEESLVALAEDLAAHWPERADRVTAEHQIYGDDLDVSCSCGWYNHDPNATTDHSATAHILRVVAKDSELADAYESEHLGTFHN